MDPKLDPDESAPASGTSAAAQDGSVHEVTGPSHDHGYERSHQIIAAAYELLATEGLEGLTIRAVLERTGLARRAFYESFAGKDDLVLAVFERTIRMAAAQFSAQIAALTDPLERLKVIVTNIVIGAGAVGGDEGAETNRRSAALSREHLRLAESRSADLQAALHPLVMLIAEQLSDGMKAGLVRKHSPHRLASLVYNVVSTTVHTELIAQEGGKPNREGRILLANEIWEFCRRAIAA